MYGGMCTGHYTQSCLELQRLCDKLDITIYFGHLYNESLVQRGRNKLTKKFLETNATHLFWCDADIEFKAVDVLNMIFTGKEVIGGLYTKKTINWMRIKQAILEKPSMTLQEIASFAGDFVVEGITNIESMNKPVEVKNIGTGFLSIKREVVEKMITPENTYKDNGETRYEIFGAGIRDGEYLSEDYWFCDNARNLGYKIYTLPSVSLTHVGTYRYTGSVSDMNNALKKA